ncbi:hypothetical protein B0H14DRAFT_3905285 [Mycena olivaceomarginata]|nr:hypothetical protein B0H14DRAFT_3905285 [Mycena olivaceomarginata]
MSDTNTSRSFLDGSPFTTFNTPGDTRSGIDLFFSPPDLFSFLPPPYNLTDADVLPTPGRPFLIIHPEEIGFLTVQVSEDSWKALYFLAHPAIYRLLPFARVPECIRCMDPGYLATILDRAMPVFETLHRTYPLVPHTRMFMTLAALLHLVLAVRELIPTCARDDWLAFLPEGESAHSAHWDMYPPLSFGWLFPCTQEFPEDQPLCDTFLLTDHVTLRHIAQPSFHALAAFLVKGRVYDTTDLDRVIQLLDNTIAPENTIFQTIANEFRAGRLSAHITHTFFNTVQDLIDYLPADRRNAAWMVDFFPEDPASASLLPCRFEISHGPHKDSLEEPYPVQGSRAGTYSPHYKPTTLPEHSVTPLLGPVTPPAQTGPSAVGSASFDIRLLRGSPRKDPPTPRKASAIAASPSNSTKMQVDPPEMSSADALPITEAMDDLPPRRSPPRTAARGKHISCRVVPKSITPPASEAYNEEGEEEKEDEEEEEEEELPRPAKRQRTGPASSKSKETSSRFPIPVRKTRRKNKKGELPAYVPPETVPTMDTVTLAAETLANGQREPTVFDAGCSNCILCDRECDQGAPRSLCEHCNKGCLSHCSHTFAVTDHARATNHLEPYTRLSNERGNELITDLSAARADYELAREQLFRTSALIAVASNHVSAWIRQTVASLGPYDLPHMTEIPEALCPLWGQLLIDAEAELSIDYRAAVMRYPFISDPRWTDLPTDKYNIYRSCLRQLNWAPFEHEVPLTHVGELECLGVLQSVLILELDQALLRWTACEDAGSAARGRMVPLS